MSKIRKTANFQQRIAVDTKNFQLWELIDCDDTDCIVA